MNAVPFLRARQHTERGAVVFVAAAIVPVVWT
jgi:hypothetical protein